MTELFADIPDYIRTQTNFWIDFALKQKDLISSIKIIEDYRNSCLNDYERDYVDFAFNVALEQLQ